MSRAPLSPVAQGVLTSALISGERHFIVAEKMFCLGLPYRSARLIAHEIFDFGIAVVDWGAKGYRIELDEPLIAWSLIQALCVSPVTSVVRTPRCDPVPKHVRLSGASALALVAGLAPPATRRLAVFHEDAGDIIACQLQCGRATLAIDEVELWRVPPAALAGHSCHVDLLSLFLACRERSEQHELLLLQKAILDLWTSPGC